MKMSILCSLLSIVLPIASCVPKAHKSLNTKEPHVTESEGLLNVREMLYGLQTPFCPLIIQVNRDGSYVLKRWRIGLKDKAPETYSGTISPQLVNELGLIVQSSAIQRVEGVPTYEFSMDDDSHRPPKAVFDLLEATYPRSR